jgi:hypothetical protein
VQCPVQYLVQAPEAPGQGTGRSQHRDSRRRSRRERGAQPTGAYSAEQIVEAKFFRKPRAFEKPLSPRVGCSVLLYHYLFDDVASSAPNPTNKDPLILLTILIRPGFDIHPLARSATIEYNNKNENEKIISMAIRAENCGYNELRWFINWGNKAVRKIIAFGLLTATKKAWKNNF